MSCPRRRHLGRPALSDLWPRIAESDAVRRREMEVRAERRS